MPVQNLPPEKPDDVDLNKVRKPFFPPLDKRDLPPPSVIHDILKKWKNPPATPGMEIPAIPEERPEEGPPRHDRNGEQGRGSYRR